MDLTAGKVNDAKQAQAIIEKLPADNVTVVMDRGYNDYSLFAWLSQRGTTFITRLKDNAVTTPLKKGCLSEGDNYGDYRFEFDSPAGRKACGDLQFRVVQWHDKDNDRWFNFLTNDMDLKPEQIAALYKERWQIELFFKKIKQNLKIKSFIGTNENAVMSQIWTAAIVTLLIEVLKQRSFSQMVFPKTSALRPAESHDTQKSECLARLSLRANEQRKTSRREASRDRNTGAITPVIAGQGLLFASKMQTLDLKGTNFSPCGDAHFQFGQQ